MSHQNEGEEILDELPEDDELPDNLAWGMDGDIPDLSPKDLAALDRAEAKRDDKN